MKNTLLMAAFSLIMSALAVFAQSAVSTATIKISSAPYTITAPGTYVLTGDLDDPSSIGTIMIDSAAAVTGPVVLDLKGFRVTNANKYGIAISGSVPNVFPITVKNGTVGAYDGVDVGAQGSPEAPLQDILLDNLTISADYPAISFGNVQNSTVRNCTINGSIYGITDFGSKSGNHYSNVTVTGEYQDLSVSAAPSKTVVIENFDYTVH
jgi:hypothetical protein